MADPVLSAVLSGQRAILLSWTFDTSADFQVFWKSNVPAGQEYVLLATTNAFSYTTGDLEATKTYDFYVRANVGIAYYYSNVVELIVSCGKGVILSVDPPDPPPANPATDVWGAVQEPNGASIFAIYKQTLEYGIFVLYENWVSGLGFRSMCVSPVTGDVYVAQEVGLYPGDIWMNAGGVGVFQVLGQASRRWYTMAAAPNGDIYAGVYSGDIYKRTGGVGNFVATGQTSRAWFGMTAAVNGDIYACVNSGDIYRKAHGDTTFVGMGMPSRTWRGMTGCPNGDIYACANGGGSQNLWIRYGGVGSWVDTGMSALTGRAMTCTPKGHVYLGNDGSPGGLVYIRKNGVGSFVATADPNFMWMGLGARTF